MPILPVEPDFHPENLWESGAETSASGRWLCLHTKPRQEKAAARQLHASDVAYYLPQAIHEARTPAGRKIRSSRPMFPSYIFMRGGDHDRLAAFQSKTLVNVLEVADQAALDRDLRQIYRMLTAGLVVSSAPSYPVGVRVRITSGPLTGLIGTVIRRGPRDRFVAVVDFLGCGGSVDLEDWQVERIDEAA